MSVVTCEMKYEHYLKAYGGKTGTTVSGMRLNRFGQLFRSLVVSLVWPRQLPATVVEL
jgi:hypothetical protein